MPQSVLEMAKELSLALIKTGNVPAEDMQDTLQKTHATLLTLKAQEEFGTTAALPAVRTAVDWRKSITKHAVACLECGKTFKQLSTRHLMMHGLAWIPMTGKSPDANDLKRRIFKGKMIHLLALDCTDSEA